MTQSPVREMVRGPRAEPWTRRRMMDITKTTREGEDDELNSEQLFEEWLNMKRRRGDEEEEEDEQAEASDTSQH